MMNNEKKSNRKIGDTIQIEGYTSFCTPHEQKIKNIIVKYDNNSGNPYDVIITEEGNHYHGKTGVCLVGASMYYMVLEG